MITYKKEIDGLRGLSVLAVLFYHADFKLNFFNSDFTLLSGGFFGVDIFFVISGYLITKIINENFNSNKFSFLNFYERRVRRIFPVLFFIILSSFFLGWLFMSNDEYLNFSYSSIFTIFFQSNLWFFLKGSYLDNSATLMPLLHTWSLSVEEQFYIFFPALLIFCLKRKSINIIIFLFLFSFLMSLLATNKYPDFSFYFIFTRMWELFFGSLAYSFELKIKNNKINIYYKSVITNLSLLLIFFSLFFINDQVSHPSAITLVPILSTVFIIVFFDDLSISFKILTNKFFVYIGLISYSLYLWHYPLFAFYRIKSDFLSNQDKIEILLVTFFLSIATFFLIEKPFRNFNIIKTKLFFFLIISISLIILFFGSFIIFKKGLKERFPEEIRKIADFSYDPTFDYSKGKCFISSNVNIKNIFSDCITQPSNKKKVFLWGDSLAAQLIPGLINQYGPNNKFIIRTVEACPSYLFHENDKCKNINEIIFQELKLEKPETLVIAGSWGQDQDKLDHDILNLEKTFKLINDLNINKVVVFGPVVRWNKPPKKIIIKHYQKKRNIPDFLEVKNFDKLIEFEIYLKNLTKKNNFTYISHLEKLCDLKLKSCKYFIDGNPEDLIYWDENHFTHNGSIYFIKSVFNFL